MSKVRIQVEVLFLLALASGGCKSVPPALLDTIAQADANFDAGNHQAALDGYSAAMEEARRIDLVQKIEARPSIEVRIGQCQLALGRPEEAVQQFEAIDALARAETLELAVGLRVDKGLAHAEAQLDLGRRSEPLGALRDRSNVATQEAAAKSALRHFEAAQALFDRVLAMAPDSFEATLGAAYTFLQLGYLNRNESALRQADQFLARCQAQSPDYDPRFHFYRGKVKQFFYAKGTLSEESLANYAAAVERDRNQKNFSYHELYRDLYRQVEPYPTPRALAAADPAVQERVQVLYRTLGDYVQYGRRPENNWPHWQAMRTRLEQHLGVYNEWIRADEAKRRLIGEAHALVHGETQASGLEAYRLAMASLAGVDTRFHAEPSYVETRKLVQVPYVQRVIASAEQLMGLGQWDRASGSVREALKVCDKNFDPDAASTVDKCHRVLDKIKARQKWAALSAKVRELARTDRAQALEHLDENVVELGDSIGEEEIAALTAEISNQDVLEVKSLLAQGGKLEAENPTLALEKYVAADALVTEKKLEQDLKDDVVRAMARAYFGKDEFQTCLDLLGDRDKDPPDRILKGLCLYRKGDFSRSKSMFSGIDYDILISGAPAGNAKAANNPLFIAGLANLRAGDAAGARHHLERAREVLPDSSELRGARLDCYRQLLSAGSLPAHEERRLLEEVLALDEADAAARHRLAMLLYEDGKATQARASFERAYQLMSRNQEAGNLVPLTDDERGRFSRLVASFADYIPMKAGASWEYQAKGSKARSVCTVTGGSGDRFDVTVEELGAVTRQEWLKVPSSRELIRAVQGSRQVLLVGLSSPEQEPVEKRDLLGKRVYVTRVAGVGLSVNVGGIDYENCIEVELREEGQDSVFKFYFAPNVGQIKYTVRNEEWELVNSTMLTGAAAKRLDSSVKPR